MSRKSRVLVETFAAVVTTTNAAREHFARMGQWTFGGNTSYFVDGAG